MKNKNLLIVLCAVALIALVAVLAVALPQRRTISDDAPVLSPSKSPVPASAPETSAQPAPEAVSQTENVNAYLVVTVCGVVYEPLPLAGEGSFRISMNESTSNTIHVTPDSIWMEHSTCENQDCVEQGVVSLENMNTRVLTNMIICLPNEVVLELHTPETLKETFGVAYSP